MRQVLPPPLGKAKSQTRLNRTSDQGALRVGAHHLEQIAKQSTLRALAKSSGELDVTHAAEA